MPSGKGTRARRVWTPAADGLRLMNIDISIQESEQTEGRLPKLQSELAQVSSISAVGALAATLAHELNQPLTAVTNYVEAARDLLHARSFDIDILHEALDQAAAESLRAGEIVRRLREFIARGETERSVHSLGKLVTEASVLATAGLDEPEVDVSIMLDPDADLVLVNRVQIQQVLFNILKNALEVLESVATRRIEISSVPVSDILIEIIVSDSGTGLSAEAEAALFEPFHSTKHGGMGLGLSICRNIVESQGGRIWADRSPLGGTAFHFTLARAA